MPHSKTPHPRRGAQAWLSAGLVVVGALFVVAALALFLGGDPSTPRDFRTISRTLIIGAAFGAYGVWRMLSSRDAAEKPEASAPPSPERHRPSAGANLGGMLLHADDVLATLRDVVAHAPKDSFGTVSELLSRAGLLGWSDAPENLRVIHLTRNGRWWLRLPKALSEHDYDLLVGIEAALNLTDDIEGGKGAAVRDVLAAVASIDPCPYGGTFDIGTIVGASTKGGEWQLRARLADFLENCPLPFRIGFDHQANAEIGLVCVDVDCPRPASFTLVGDGETTATDEARAYALRLALLVARGAIEVAGAVRAVVNCREPGSEHYVLSIDVTQSSLERLLRLASKPGLASAELPSDPSLHAHQQEGGWLDAIEPFLRRDSKLACPPGRFHDVGLDGSPASDAIRRTCGARHMCDLGIQEAASRMEAWNSIVKELGETTHEAVSKLVDLRDASADVTVVEACERTSKALVEGTLDVADKQGLARLFVDGSPLAQAVRHADMALGTEKPSAQELSSTLEELEGALAPITEVGIYLDDSATVYRYFNSVAERVLYNRTVNDGTRSVDLVPDAYYNAHSSASRILNMLGRSEEAMSHAQEAMRVAPVTTDAKLGMVRCLEDQSRIFEAADLLKDAIAGAATVRDMAICFYRLAFMEWKLGRADLAVACYQRAIALHPEIAPQARSELDELLASEVGLSELPEAEVSGALEAAEIPAGPVDDLRSVMLGAAAACTDACAFSVAKPLVGVVAEMGRDDVIIDVHRSLTVT